MNDQPAHAIRSDSPFASTGMLQIRPEFPTLSNHFPELADMKLSARNQLKGTVIAIEKGAVNSTVLIDVGNGTIITSMITNAAVADLGLAKGVSAYAIVKASDVMVAVD